MIRRWLDRQVFDEWIGSLDGRTTLERKRLWSWRGWQLSLHRMVGQDDAGCFHTHPATALRIVLAGGYLEELEDGRTFAWLPGMFGIVRPATSHRIARLLDDRSYSLWLRGQKTAAIELRGDGWTRGAA